MSILEALDRLRPPWLDKLSHRLARAPGVRESLREQLDAFYHLLHQAVETGDPEWLDTLLDDWIGVQTQTEPESPSILLPIMNEIWMLTFEVISETLANGEALEMTGSILPVFSHAFIYVAEREMLIRVRQIQEETDEARKAIQQLERSKSDFISIAAHELKTPLTLIDGYTDMLGDQLEKDQSLTPAVHLLEGIKTGNKRLREIVDDMIDVSLIDNNMLSLRFQPYWVEHLVKTLVEEAGPSAAARRISLEVESLPFAETMLFGDEERLHQAVGNVLENAIKYTPDGGRVIIRGRVLPGFHELTITDTGIGIDPNDQSRIFRKFGQIENASLHSSGKTKFKGGGPGLGLPISKGILESHGGTIWVESPGYDEEHCPGSTFHILIPLITEPPDEKMQRLFSLRNTQNEVADT